MVNIFDCAARFDGSPAKTEESNFDFINRSSQAEIKAIRSQISSLLDHYPQKNCDALISRLKSQDKHQFESASFELLLNYMLKKIGHNVLQIEPEAKNRKTPDFLATDQDGNEYYLEATVALGESKSKASAEKRLHDFLTKLNQVNSPTLHLGFSTRHYPRENVPLSSIRKAVQPWIDDLPPFSEQATKRLQKFSINDFNFSLKVVAPRGPNSTQPIATVNPPGFVRTPGDGIRDALIKKGSRYRDLENPLVVAIRCPIFIGGLEDVSAALFGSPKTVFRKHKDGSLEILDDTNPDGAFLSKKPRYTSISALAVFKRFTLWDFVDSDASIYHHPWAKKPIKPDSFPLSQYVANLEKCELEKVEGRKASDFLSSLGEP